MPKIGKKGRDHEEILSDDDLVELALATRAEFESGFKRSRKGNLWRNYEGLTLTIFRRRGDDYYGWSIADSDGVRFSPGGCETEEDALSALSSELAIGAW